MAGRRKPRLAVWKLASCDGCQLALLERELLRLVEEVEVAYWPLLTRTRLRGPYDVSIVEGSVTTPRHLHRLRRARRASRKLVAVGACATAGGIQALRNFGDVDAWIRATYAEPRWIDVSPGSTPVGAHVATDVELPGCPVDAQQLLEVVAALLRDRRPNLHRHSLCLECKRLDRVCVTVARGTPCLGPVTQAGCGALCPAHERGCFGCFGPQETPNTAALGARLRAGGVAPAEVRDLFRGFAAASAAFARESRSHE